MTKDITVRATLENLDTVLGFVEENLEMVQCPMKIAMKITVCIEELFVNVASYAYDGSDGPCKILMESDDGSESNESNSCKIRITISDNGKAFNPLEKEDPDTTLDAEEREVGGLGIFMVKNIMDKIHYERNQGYNIIIMEKSW